MILVARMMAVSAWMACSASALAMNNFYANEFNPSTYTKVITVSGGLSWAQAGKTQTVYPVNPFFPPISTVTYTADNNTSTMGQGELFLGLQWPFNDCIFNQLGFAFGGAGTAKTAGQVIINNVPTSSRYSYRTGHGFISARGKMILNPAVYYVQPYITGSVGIGMNQAFGFQTYPYVDPAFSSRWFANKTFYGLTYSVGLGLEKSLNANWHVGVGYEFSDWGESGLGPAINSSWTYNGPHLTSIYAHNLSFSLSYLC